MPRISNVVDYFYILAWNIYIGNGELVARRALKEHIKTYNPHVLAIMEATRLHGNLEGLGYQVVHLKASPRRPGNIPNDANIALLVRNDLKIKRSFVHRMTTFWKGPKHGHAQDPRVYRSVRILALGTTWRVACAHTPFGAEARLESRLFLIRWLQRALPKVATVLVLDANMGLKEFDDTIVEPGGAEAGGIGVELIAVKNCYREGTKNLGKGPSDHPAVVHTLYVEER